MIYPDFKYDYVTSIIEASGSIVYNNVLNNKIPGLSLVIELIKGEEPSNKTIGILVKSSTDCKKIDDNYILDLSYYQDYYKNNQLPLLIVVINENKYVGYWTYLEKPFVEKVKISNENIFDLKTFNLDVIPYMLTGNTIYSNIIRELNHIELSDFREYCLNIFEYLDFAVPYILKNETFEDFLEDTNIEYKLYELDSMTAHKNIAPKVMTDGIIIKISGKHTWWFITEGQCHISKYFFVRLKNIYYSLKQKAIKVES